MMEQAAQHNMPPPASEEAITSLPQVHVKKSELGEHADCAICQDEYEENDRCVQLPCKHLFHPKCIEIWLKMNGTCPICRHSIADNSPIGEASASQ
jgi:E3 ubiquitin-protein ligase RNF115/126